MIKQIRNIVGKENVLMDYPLKKCCSFGIGGRAKYFVSPESLDALFNLIEFIELHSIRYKIVGNGTNILFGDDIFNGVIITTKKLNSIQLIGERNLLVAAGCSLTDVITFVKNENLSGLEFAVGIPGSVGGAIVMNAGAGGSDISAVVKSVTVLENDDIRTIEKEKLEFDYRSSYFLKNRNTVILFAELELVKATSRAEIEEKMESNLKRRLQTQPRERSAGCVFKKSDEFPAGLLIDKAGLKGRSVGGAEVSSVHANFIVNKNGATAKDVKNLIEIIRLEVFKQFNKKLELEIEIIE